MTQKKFSHKELILVSSSIAVLGVVLILLIGLLQHELSKKPTQVKQTSPNMTKSLSDGKQKEKAAFTRPVHEIAFHDQSFSVGSNQPKVTVVEFLDFQCPFCKQMVPVFHQLIREYENKPVTFVFRHFPIITKHEFAFNSALGAECARDQQAFLPMHDLLYENQDGFNNATISASASALNLNLTNFNTCLAERKYQTRITKDLSDGFDLGVSGTPAIYINDHIIIGATPYEELKNIIDHELQKNSSQ